MNRILSISLMAAAAMSVGSCASHYEMAGVSRSRILIDGRYDKADKAADEFIKPYKAKVDSMMSPVVGTAAKALEARQPESPLSNLLADILVWASPEFGERPDFAVYNMGGIRASFAKGDVTYGDVLDVAPFENKICFLSLTGDKVRELFSQMAGYGGQAVSHGVEAVMDRDGRIVSLRINGEPVDDSRTYRIATLDYVAEGNDKMVAFKQKTQVNSPKSEKNNVRNLIIKYFQAAAAQGRSVDANVEGRFRYQNQ